MSRLRIYGIARTRAFRVLWMAHELGLDYEHRPIEIGAAGARQAEYLAINPNGRLPAIEDDGFVLAVRYDGARDESAVVVLDARSFDAKPLAVATLRHRIPQGFHGNFATGVV